MEKLHPDQGNIWQTPEMKALMMRHVAEAINAGVYGAYNAKMRELYGEDPEFLDKFRNASSETPLMPFVNYDASSETGIPSRAYYLERVDPSTGTPLGDDYANSTLAHAFYTDTEQQPIAVESMPGLPLSRDQQDLIIRHAQELEQVGVPVTF